MGAWTSVGAQACLLVLSEPPYPVAGEALNPGGAIPFSALLRG